LLFNSYEFIFLFLPFTFFIYFYLLHKRLATAAKGFLVFASLFFYSWWNIAYLPLILLSILFNYAVGNSLNENFKKVRVSKKTLLWFGVVANFALLGYFKYSDFFIQNLNLALSSNVGLLHLVLPLGISFFTFTQIAYLVDSYKGETAEYDFLNYGLFVTFFPHLLAGPILHHSEMMPQFASKWNMVKNYRNVAMGLFLFSIGLFKKVVIADTFAVWTNAGFDTATTLNLFEAWATSLSFTFQLYFDFSGYTDMAIGVALLFNIRLPINFNSPYKALNIQDFWRRWHITLSRFLRDYVYISLGGNRGSSFATYNNLLATFIIGGIWHGAGWTFVFWGFLHGVALVVHKFWSRFGLHMPKVIAWFITFNFVNIAWVFFRAKEWEDAVRVISSMFSFDNVVLANSLSSKLSFLQDYGITFGGWVANVDSDGGKFLLPLLLLGFILILFFGNSNQKLKSFKLSYKTALFAGIAFIGGVLSLNKVSEFLYFNF